MSTQTVSRRIPRDTFALRLKIVRVELGLTIDEMAERCGLVSATLSTWERGARPRDFSDVVRKIVAATGYDREWLTWGGPLAEDGGDSPDGLPHLDSNQKPAGIGRPVLRLLAAA